MCDVLLKLAKSPNVDAGYGWPKRGWIQGLRLRWLARQLGEGETAQMTGRFIKSTCMPGMILFHHQLRNFNFSPTSIRSRRPRACDQPMSLIRQSLTMFTPAPHLISRSAFVILRRQSTWRLPINIVDAHDENQQGRLNLVSVDD